MSGNRTIDDVPLALLETIEQTWRQADEFSAKANEEIDGGLMQLRTLLATPAVLCHGCLKETNNPNHFDEAGQCTYRKPSVSHRDTAALLQVYDLIGLSYSHPGTVLLANLKDMKGAADFLHAIENEAFEGGENASEPEFQDLEPPADGHVSRWASSKDQRIEQFRSALTTLTERRRADMDALFEVVEHCYQLASDHSVSVDDVFEQGGHLHPNPLCAVFYQLHSVLLLARLPATEGFGYLKSGRSLFELIPTLISENEELKAKTQTWCGYGNDDAMHTFYGDAPSIRALGDIIFELEGLRQDAKRPWWSRLLPFSRKTMVGSPAVLTNTSGQAHCPHCAVCHTAEETCIQALRRILALYEGTKQGSGGVAPCA